jgi:hypothetical protein
MNMSDEERFCGLAHKALAKEAVASEQAELEGLMAQNANLKREFEQMKMDAAAAREILPLLEDIEHPQGQPGRLPMERLRREVRGVFDRRKGSKPELRGLLARLEEWVAGGQTGGDRETGAALVAALRGALLGEPVEAVQKSPMHFPRAAALSEPSLPMREAAGTGVAPVRRVLLKEARKYDVDLEARLDQLEKRLTETQHHVQECGEEVHALLEMVKRERELVGRRLSEGREGTTR